MNVTEEIETAQLVRRLWADYFPHRDTPATEMQRVLANKKWIADSLIFYGWAPNDDKLDITIKFIDGGACLYHGQTPCALVSILNNALRITYVDNRTQ